MTSPAPIYGALLDGHGRCTHYHSELDVVALRCGQCLLYYACFQCHDRGEKDHRFVPWPKARIADNCVMCGACRNEMTQDVYQAVVQCPSCSVLFNPGCAKHKHLYFEQ